MDTEFLFRPPLYVLWNLFLALVPVVLALIIAYTGNRFNQPQQLVGPIQVPLIILWLAFLPNTCYLLTEWRHYLETISASPLVQLSVVNKDAMLKLLMSTVFYFLYSGIGLVAFFMAIWPLDRMVRQHRRRYSLVMLALFFFFCALGVYLGLIPRFNSWDLVHIQGLHRILDTTLTTLSRPLRVWMIASFGGVLWLSYSLFDIFMDGVLWRVRAQKSRRSLRTQEDGKKIENAGV